MRRTASHLRCGLAFYPEARQRFDVQAGLSEQQLEPDLFRLKFLQPLGDLDLHALVLRALAIEAGRAEAVLPPSWDTTIPPSVCLMKPMICSLMK